jgi:hypothetical protein
MPEPGSLVPSPGTRDKLLFSGHERGQGRRPAAEAQRLGPDWTVRTLAAGERRGDLTASAVEPLIGHIASSPSELAAVRPDAVGRQRGLGPAPAARGRAEAARRDPSAGEDLTFADALRLGDARIRGVAAELLTKRSGRPRQRERPPSAASQRSTEIEHAVLLDAAPAPSSKTTWVAAIDRRRTPNLFGQNPTSTTAEGRSLPTIATPSARRSACSRRTSRCGPQCLDMLAAAENVAHLLDAAVSAGSSPADPFATPSACHANARHRSDLADGQTDNPTGDSPRPSGSRLSGYEAY